MHPYYAAALPRVVIVLLAIAAVALVLLVSWIINQAGEWLTRPRIYDWARECDFPVRGSHDQALDESRGVALMSALRAYECRSSRLPELFGHERRVADELGYPVIPISSAPVHGRGA